MPWPIMTNKESLKVEMEAANDFLERKKLPTIKSLEFIDEEDCSYISVNSNEYFIDYRTETVMRKSLRGEFPVELYSLRAFYSEEPHDPEEAGGERDFVEVSEFRYGSLAGFLVLVEMEKIYHEWRDFRNSLIYG